jgi:hypothetical protein
MRKVIFSLLAIVAIVFGSCSKDEQNTKTMNKEGDGYYRLYTLTDSIDTADVNHDDILTFTNQLLDKYTVVDKDNVNFLPVDNSAIDNESNETLTAKPKVICHKHPFFGVHSVVVMSNNQYYLVLISDGDLINDATVSVISLGGTNPC